MNRRMLRQSLFALFSVVCGLVAACDDLPDFELGICGNSIVDRDNGEECDWAPELATRCAEKTDGECENRCAPAGDAYECQILADVSGGCPGDSPAGQDGVCRRPSGRFQSAPIDAVPVVGVDGQTADLDGDGARDLVVTSPLDGSDTPSVTYFQAAGGYLGPFPVPVPPAIGKLTDDDLGATATPDDIDDLVLPIGPALITLRGASGPALLPKAYTPFRIDAMLPPGTAVRLFAHARPGFFDVPYAVAELNVGATWRLVFAQIDAGGFVPKPPNLTLDLKLLGAGPDDLIAIDLISDLPGEEIVAASAEGIVIAAPKELATDPDELIVSLAAPGLTGLYRLAGEATPAIGVITDDGKLRILRSFDTAGIPADFDTSLDLPGGIVGTDVLAVGHLDADGRLDAVLRSGAFLHVFDPLDEPRRVGSPTSGSWSQARIADLNGDGRLSVVALPSSDVDVLLPGSEFAMNPALISVGGVLVDTLAIADFDGDGVDDILVATEPEGAGDGCEDTDDLYLAFGRSNGPPEEPVNVGQLRGVRRLAPARLEAPTVIDAIYDVGVQTRCAPATPEDGVSAGLLLGATSRDIFSPFLPFLPSDETRREILRVAVGELGRTPSETEDGPGHPDIAVLFTKGPASGPLEYFVARMAAGGDAELVPITATMDDIGLLGAREVSIGMTALGEAQRHVPGLAIRDLFPGHAEGEVIAWLASDEWVRLSVTGLAGDTPSELFVWTEAMPLGGRKSVGKLRVLDVDGDKALDVVAFLFVDDKTEPLYAWWFRNTGDDLAEAEPFQIGTDAALETPSDVASIVSPVCPEGSCDATANAVFSHSTSVSSCAVSVAASATRVCSNVVVDAPPDADALGPERILATLVDDVDLDGLQDLIVFRLGGTFVHRQCSMSEVNSGGCNASSSGDTAVSE